MITYTCNVCLRQIKSLGEFDTVRVLSPNADVIPDSGSCFAVKGSWANPDYHVCSTCLLRAVLGRAIFLDLLPTEGLQVGEYLVVPLDRNTSR